MGPKFENAPLCLLLSLMVVRSPLVPHTHREVFLDLGPYLTCQIYNEAWHTALPRQQRFNHAFIATDLSDSFSALLVGETFDPM